MVPRNHYRRVYDTPHVYIVGNPPPRVLYHHVIDRMNKYGQNHDCNCIPANPKTSEIATNGRKLLKNYRDIPEFSIHYYRHIFAKIGAHCKLALSFYFLFVWSK